MNMYMNMYIIYIYIQIYRVFAWNVCIRKSLAMAPSTFPLTGAPRSAIGISSLRLQTGEGGEFF